MYCKTCNDLICVRCSQVEPHRSHTITDISEGLCREMREELRLLEERATHHRYIMEEALERVVRQINQVTGSAKQAYAAINDTFDAIVAQVQRRREEVLPEWDQNVNEKTTALTSQRDELGETKTQLGGLTANVRKLVEKGTVEDHYTLKAAARQRACQLVQHSRTLKRYPVRDDTIAFIPRGYLRVLNHIRQVGRIQHSKFELAAGLGDLLDSLTY